MQEILQQKKTQDAEERNLHFFPFPLLKKSINVMWFARSPTQGIVT
jgi:hypothetical protein